jgi:hypothetical protein
MNNLYPIMLLLTAALTFAFRSRFAKYALLLGGSVFLCSCLSLRLGKNELPQQAPARTEVAYTDQVPASGPSADPQNR